MLLFLKKTSDDKPDVLKASLDAKLKFSMGHNFYTQAIG